MEKYLYTILQFIGMQTKIMSKSDLPVVVMKICTIYYKS